MKINDLELLSGCRRADRLGRADPIAAGADHDRDRAWRAGANRGLAGASASLPRGARPCWPCWRAEASTTSRSCTRSRRSRRRRCDRRSKWPCGTCSAGCCGSRCAICWADTIGGGCPSRSGWPDASAARRRPNLPRTGRTGLSHANHRRQRPARRRPQERWRRFARWWAIGSNCGSTAWAATTWKPPATSAAGMEFDGLQFFLDPLQYAGAARRGVAGAADERSAGGVAGDPRPGRRADRRALQRGAVRGGRSGAGGRDRARPGVRRRGRGGRRGSRAGRPALGGHCHGRHAPLAAATAAFSTSNELASRQLRDTVLADSLEITDGMITVPQAHGPGRGRWIGRRWRSIRRRKESSSLPLVM